MTASRGLTDGEIADRCSSPRTAAPHLYNSNPKLGIAARHQLRDLTDQASAGPPLRRSADSRRPRADPINRDRKATDLRSTAKGRIRAATASKTAALQVTELNR